MIFEYVIDSIASIAAIVAIFTALVSWYRSARRPLRVDRVVVHNIDDSSNFILVLRNVQNYPVRITRASCYFRKRFRIQQRTGGAPEYSKTFTSLDRIFDTNADFEVPASGYTEFKIEGVARQSKERPLFFHLATSHGYHERRCDDVTLVEIGKAEAYSLAYEKDFNSAWKARLVYIWRKILPN